MRDVRPVLLLTALLAGCAVSPDSDIQREPAATASGESPTEFVAPDIKDIWPISTRY